ncbi:hypothetical protein AB0L34_13055 [Micromonospora sp. NPDC052213]|uniref:hypothetical protein n=1 Tax=Micromonospora sp. NPDC052213 TaxID=3155812 RepID=UPI00341BAADB
MLALAVLTILTATAAARRRPGDHRVDLAEIRRLLNSFVLAVALPPAHILHWSIWRRTSQARARRAHYQHRQAK